MKRLFATLLIGLALFTTANAQDIKILHDDCDYLQIQVVTSRPYITTTLQNGSVYSEITLDGFVNRGEIGRPKLPVMHRNIEVPVCDDIVVEISNTVFDTIDAIAHRVVPQQRPRSKSDTSARTVVIDDKAYMTDSFYRMPLAAINYLGTARDRRLATLDFAPVSYNPVSGQIVVCRQADITIRFTNSDRKATEQLYRRYHSPAFSVGPTLNNLPTKAVRTTAPVRMVIVSAPAFRDRLDNFVNWKRLTGFIVDVVYTDDASVGTTTTSISNYLRNLYTEATEQNPAPTYVLLVGDDNLIPAFTTHISASDLANNFGVNQFVSDLYYATWSGDDLLPEAYYGRFSARTNSQINNIVTKTVMYERYTMSDPSYLSTGILVAGVDGGQSGDNGYERADPTMDYIAKYYVNSANGYSTVYYYKNKTDFAPSGVTVTGSSNSQSNASTLRNLYNAGAGWINYSAHGDVTMWYSPQFNVSHVNGMTNNNKPSIIIGNCCLSNRFNEDVCLGEALLRKGSNAGAAAYFGATNETFWDEDFYWAVGIRSSISGTMNATYNSNYLGMYDRLFHTHNEAYNKYTTSAGAMLLAGNQQVINIGVISGYYQGTYYVYDFPTYYAETYTLMGDPSLMPWLGIAADATANIGNLTATSLSVTTDPYAYVALTDNQLNLIAAAYAGANGAATLSYSSLADGSYNLAITSQNHKPYIDTLTFPANDTTAVEPDTNSTVDTVFIHDTITMVLHDTVYLHDTLYIYDTVYLDIENPNASQTKIYLSDGTIVIDGETSGTASLYDVSGRRLTAIAIRNPRTEIRVPASGTYFIQVNNRPAHKITIVR